MTPTFLKLSLNYTKSSQCSLLSDLSFPICFSSIVFSFCPLNVDVYSWSFAWLPSLLNLSTFLDDPNHLYSLNFTYVAKHFSPTLATLLTSHEILTTHILPLLLNIVQILSTKWDFSLFESLSDFFVSHLFNSICLVGVHTVNIFSTCVWNWSPWHGDKVFLTFVSNSKSTAYWKWNLVSCLLPLSSKYM